jgi:hypothetical protein
MDRSMKQWIALSIATLSVFANGAVVCAYSPELPHSIQTQLDALRLKLDDAERVNHEIRLELNEAQAEHQGGNWLTDQRQEEVAHLVREVLADTDARTQLQGNGAMMGWSNGFYLRSADKQFELNIGGMTQIRYMASWRGHEPDPTDNLDKWENAFGIPRTKLMFGGNAFGKGLEYYLETGWATNNPDNLSTTDNKMVFRLWDAWVKFRLNSDFAIKLGQFTIPFTRESMVRAQNQLAIERTNIDHRMGLGRSTGAELTWASNDRRLMAAYTNGSAALYHDFVYVRTEPNPPWAALGKDTLYSFSLRHEWKVLGGWEQFKQFTSPPGSEKGVLIGVAWHRQNIEQDTTIPAGGIPEGTFWGLTGDLSLQFDGASAFFSVTYERVTNFNPTILRANWLGFVAQGSTYISNQTELFARWESGGVDSDAMGGNDLMLLTVGANHYLDGQDLKLSADVGFSFGDVSSVMMNRQTGWRTDNHNEDQLVLRTQLQMMF